MSLIKEKFNLFSFTGKMKILHSSWLAFFICFVVWFNHMPLLKAIQTTFGLSESQINALLLLNFALTIPARIVVGILVDKFGPRLVFSWLLASASIPCFIFAFADSYAQLALSRFLLGFVGASFVIGIRLIGEWFPAKQMGIAEGIYGGWGNFGSGAAAFTLPTLAFLWGGENGWRYSVGMTGLIALIYSGVFYRLVRDTPKGSTYFKPKKSGALEVTSRSDYYFYMAMLVPLYAVLALITWQLSLPGVEFLRGQGKKMEVLLSPAVAYGIYALLLGLLSLNLWRVFHVNREVLSKPVPQIHQYKFKQVAILNLAYMVTFGSEIAVISMLPLYFQNTFHLNSFWAGVAGGASFILMALIARPLGGLLSDKYKRKPVLSIVLAGMSICYLVISTINPSWPLVFAVIPVFLCSIFVQAGAGAVFAIVPLIKRRLTGQIAGLTGAYGNLGGSLFLLVLLVLTPQLFFLVIAASSLVVLGIVQFLDEPRGATAEILPDGTVQMIEVE